jgi:hypothetical protein
LRGSEKGGVDAVGGILELRIARCTIVAYTRREDVVGVLVVRGERGEQEILLGCVQVEGRTILEVVGGSSHRERWCGVQRKETVTDFLSVVLKYYSLVPSRITRLELGDQVALAQRPVTVEGIGRRAYHN